MLLQAGVTRHSRRAGDREKRYVALNHIHVRIPALPPTRYAALTKSCPGHSKRKDDWRREKIKHVPQNGSEEAPTAENQ